MLVLCAKKNSENKERYYNGKYFVCGKNHALDISGIAATQVEKYISALYKYLETTPERGTINYYTKTI